VEKNFILKSLIRDYQQLILYYRLQLRTVNFEISSSTSYWGQYDPKSATIKLTERLIENHPWPVVLGVLKHELAHHYVHEKFKNSDQSDHGPEFHKACEKLGVPLFFRRAQVDLTLNELDWRHDSILSAENPLFEKIKKLMALACSENENEAQVASQKIQELLTKNQITSFENQAAPEYQHLNILFKNSRVPLYIKQIISILVEHFFVYAVFQNSMDVKKSAKIAMVELMGQKQDLLIAESVYYFLFNEVQQLFSQNESHKRSHVDKKSLAWGFLDGFSKQLEKDKQVQRQALQSKALILKSAEEKLVDYSRSIFPRLRNTGSRQTINQQAYNSGHELGKKVKLRQVIEQKSKAFGHLIGSKT
jgi:hypothetical protein